jgi:hypothetical protein
MVDTNGSTLARPQRLTDFYIQDHLVRRPGAARALPRRRAVQKAVWERRSCGAGTKGARYYDRAAVSVTVKDQPPADGYSHLLLIRRSISDPSEIEFFLAHAPAPTPIPELITVAGMRWKIEENNAQGKDLLGLDQYQVRKWTPWHRHVTTCMLAHAFLAATGAQLENTTHPARARPADPPTADPTLTGRDPPPARPHPAHRRTRHRPRPALVAIPPAPPNPRPHQPRPPTRRPLPAELRM